MKRRFFLSIRTAWLLILALGMFWASSGSGQQMHRNPEAQHRFGDVKLWAPRLEDPERDKWQKPDEVMKNLKLKPGDVIADIGAGTGYFTRRFAAAVGPGGKALGLDLESSMVDHMKEDARRLNLKNYEARAVKADDPMIAPRSVDVIFLCNTYHHMENRVSYFKRLRTGLKPNGRVVIVDFYDKQIPVGPMHRVSKETIVKELKQAGYNLKRSLHFLPYQYFLEFGL